MSHPLRLLRVVLISFCLVALVPLGLFGLFSTALLLTGLSRGDFEGLLFSVALVPAVSALWAARALLTGHARQALWVSLPGWVVLVLLASPQEISDVWRSPLVWLALAWLGGTGMLARRERHQSLS